MAAPPPRPQGGTAASAMRKSHRFPARYRAAASDTPPAAAASRPGSARQVRAEQHCFCGLTRIAPRGCAPWTRTCPSRRQLRCGRAAARALGGPGGAARRRIPPGADMTCAFCRCAGRLGGSPRRLRARGGLPEQGGGRGAAAGRRQRLAFGFARDGTGRQHAVAHALGARGRLRLYRLAGHARHGGGGRRAGGQRARGVRLLALWVVADGHGSRRRQAAGPGGQQETGANQEPGAVRGAARRRAAAAAAAAVVLSGLQHFLQRLGRPARRPCAAAPPPRRCFFEAWQSARGARPVRAAVPPRAARPRPLPPKRHTPCTAAADARRRRAGAQPAKPSTGKSSYRGVRQRPWGKVRGAALRRSGRHLRLTCTHARRSSRPKSATPRAARACGWAHMTAQRRRRARTTPPRVPSAEMRPSPTSQRTRTTAARLRRCRPCSWAKARAACSAPWRPAPPLTLHAPHAGSYGSGAGSFGARSLSIAEDNEELEQDAELLLMCAAAARAQSVPASAQARLTPQLNRRASAASLEDEPSEDGREDSPSASRRARAAQGFARAELRLLRRHRPGG